MVFQMMSTCTPTSRWEPPIKEYRQLARRARLAGSANRLLVMPRDGETYAELEDAADEVRRCKLDPNLKASMLSNFDCEKG